MKVTLRLWSIDHAECAMPERSSRYAVGRLQMWCRKGAGHLCGAQCCVGLRHMRSSSCGVKQVEVWWTFRLSCRWFQSSSVDSRHGTGLRHARTCVWSSRFGVGHVQIQVGTLFNCFFCIFFSTFIYQRFFRNGFYLSWLTKKNCILGHLIIPIVRWQNTKTWTLLQINILEFLAFKCTHDLKP